MSESYKLLKSFPGSPEKGSIAILDKTDDNLFEIYSSDGTCLDKYINREYIDDYPNYWELLIPHKEETFDKFVEIHFLEREYNIMMNLVKLAIKENIFIDVYRDAGNFFEEFEKNNYVNKDITLKIPIAYIKVLTNSLGSIIYSHQQISLSKRRELKQVLNKIEASFNYMNERKESSKLLEKLINKIKKWL